MNSENPVVAIIMGSDSDWPIMEGASLILSEFGIEHEVDVVSAHRTPEAMLEFAKSAAGRGIKVIIAGAGGAAHLPGMVASLTTLPVIGVPVPLKYLDGMDSLLSIVQMPGGIPVATVGVGNSKNAGLLAARILAVGDQTITAEISKYMDKAREDSLAKSDSLKKKRTHKTGFSA